MSEPFDYTYLSLGAGVQSSALYVASTLGLHGVARADAAIFADTQDEPRWVYDYLAALEAWGATTGGPKIHKVTAGCMSQHIRERHEGSRSRFATIPAFVKGRDGRAAPGRRQCTREYKIDPIQRYVKRTLLGYAPRARVKHRVAAMIGISLDEIDRAKPSPDKWVTRLHPLLDARLRRADCIRLVTEAGLPMPRKSSCVYCPYHSDAFWEELQRDHPDEFERACVVDDLIRDMRQSGLKSDAFLHRSLRPLREIDFTGSSVGIAGQQLLFDDGMRNECDGACGV